MYQDICKFLPKFNNYDFFNVINIVNETKCPEHSKPSVIATHRMYMIVEGEGILRTELGEQTVAKGDVIVMPPSYRFAIDNPGGLVFVYASYLGVRAGILAESYKTGSVGAVFKGYSHLIPMWLSMTEKTRENASVCCEGVILYTFSEIGETLYQDEKPRVTESTAAKIKELIDKRFTDSELDLERIGAMLNYHPKYVSSVFVKEYKVSINKYIRTMRVQNACALIDDGLSSVKDISALSGYRDPLYFSSVFKSVMGVSPKEYMASVEKK